MENVLVIQNLNYDKFEDINLSFNSLKLVSIFGSNMCGKTTLIKLISGIISTKDSIFCNDIPLNPYCVNSFIKQIGVVFNEGDIYINDNVYDELAFPLKNLGYNKFYIKNRIIKMLDIFKIDILNKKIDELTDIEKVKFNFCLALIHKPKYLLIDDIFSTLSIDDGMEIMDIIKSIDDLCIINFTSTINSLDNSDEIYLLEDFKLEKIDYTSLLKKEKNYDSLSILYKMGKSFNEIEELF